MSARDRIASRKPTGQVSWPCILLEGEEKAGKTYAAYALTGSDKVGDSFVIDLGEGSADEYASLGRYEVVEHDGTFLSVLAQVTAIREYAREQIDAGEKPVVLIMDTMSDEWGVLVDAITAKASTSEKNRRLLANDPAAEVKVPNHLWNDANAKHRRLMTLLLTFPGIVIMTARGKEVAEIRNGSPVEGSKVWKVEGQKNLAYDATAWIRMLRTRPATLEGCRSLRVGVRPGTDEPRVMDKRWVDGGLEWFIFEAYGLDPGNAAVRDLRDVSDDADGAYAEVMTASQFLHSRVRNVWSDPDGLQRAYNELVGRGLFGELVTAPDGSTQPLGDLVQSRGMELLSGAHEPASVPQESPAAPPAASDTSADVSGPQNGSQPAERFYREPEPSVARQALEEHADEVAAQVGQTDQMLDQRERDVVEFLAELAAADVDDEYRRLWAVSGNDPSKGGKGIRDVEVDDPDAPGEKVALGRLLLRRQKALAERTEAGARA